MFDPSFTALMAFSLLFTGNALTLLTVTFFLGSSLNYINNKKKIVTNI